MGGIDQEMAEYSFGLIEGMGLWSSRQRRERAAGVIDRSSETFRKKREKEILALVAEGVLAECQTAKMRQTHADMAAHRHPADSRLAVQWVERFEAYYTIWTPVSALAADLETAFLCTKEQPQDHAPWDETDSTPYDPIAQAMEYVDDALYDFAAVELAIRRFTIEHGGMWLLSDSDTEYQVADTVYQIEWHNNLNRAERSWLRRQLASTSRQEDEAFLTSIRNTTEGTKIITKWRHLFELATTCTTKEQRAADQIWLTLEACHTYMELIDQDWLRIADWYRPGTTRPKTHEATELYDGLLRMQELAKEHAKAQPSTDYEPPGSQPGR